MELISQNGFDKKLPYHKFSAPSILLHISLVLSSTTSMRSAPRAIKEVLSFFHLPIAIASWTSIRIWLMRLGYYLLMEPKQKANDWIWLIDHSVQIGKEKCLVILGVRLSDLSSQDKTLKREDTKVIELLPVTKSNGDIGVLPARVRAS